MKKLSKNLLTVGILCLFSAIVFVIPVSAAENAAPETSLQTSDMTIFSADIIWRYKTENGKLYKRKFNTSTNKWIGEWILVK
ncbi:hypothetical protein [Anaerostipes sp.]|uniref:hypothetical protein n=1 Tax=Anaerostipes sp. TaxID=1872530 RepID=UPI0025C29E82|nr:hypothetical protein [Anaerostipes sp.]MBS7007283.1 hypothetical protein [Anaerostipes sp.]